MLGGVGVVALFGAMPSFAAEAGCWAGGTVCGEPVTDSLARAVDGVVFSDGVDSGDACSISADRGGAVSLDFEQAAAATTEDNTSAIRTVFMSLFPFGWAPRVRAARTAV